MEDIEWYSNPGSVAVNTWGMTPVEEYVEQYTITADTSITIGIEKTGIFVGHSIEIIGGSAGVKSISSPRLPKMEELPDWYRIF